MDKKIIVEDGLSINLNRGVGIYTLSLINMLNNLGFKVEVPRKHCLDDIKLTVLRRILYILWLNTVFVFNLYKRKDVKIVLFPATITPFIKQKNITYISVMHDILHLIYPETRTFVQRLHDNFAFMTASKFADRIITVSNTTKRELISRHIVENKPIDVVYNTHSTLLLDSTQESTEIITKLGLKNKKYILSVATINKHKNIQTLINSFENIANNYPDIKLVLVGNNGNGALKYSNSNIIVAGFVSNDDLKILYKNALFYVFPSLYEGFGIPLIDAQYFGLPVLCSDIEIFREIGNDSVLYAFPNEEGFEAGLTQILNSDELRNNLRTKGHINTKRFLASEITNDLKNIYEE